MCINIQFHRYGHVKYQFVWKYNKKITMEIWTDLDSFGLIWTDLDEKVGCIKEKIFSENLKDSILVKILNVQTNFLN